MKTRIGFVSNSSSSSFLIIGVCNSLLLQKVAEADGLDMEDFPYLCYGSYQSKSGLEYYGCDEPTYVGISVGDLLETMTLPEARLHVREIIRQKVGVDVPVDKLELYYGEAGNG